jgi:hypothetical protein
MKLLRGVYSQWPRNLGTGDLSLGALIRCLEEWYTDHARGSEQGYGQFPSRKMAVELKVV